jgi:hypothetical protein
VWALGVLRAVFVENWRSRYHAIKGAVCDGVGPGGLIPLDKVSLLQARLRSTRTTATAPMQGPAEVQVRTAPLRRDETQRILKIPRSNVSPLDVTSDFVK